MLTLQNLSYIHPNKDLLFDSINLTVNRHDKVALIGNNGVGKSTLLKIIAGKLPHTSGMLKTDTVPYYIPQVFGQYNQLTIAQALGVAEKLTALHQILAGDFSEENYTLLDEDWTIEERCRVILTDWQLNKLDLFQKMDTLSGGQKTKVFLAGIAVHEPELVLLDEPSNHLDVASRQLLYHFIENTKCTLIVVSHDRILLNGLNKVCELSKHGTTLYGGNYDFYAEQKQIAANALADDIQNSEKALKKAKEKQQETMERQQKLDARGKKKQTNAGVARIMMNTLRNNAENSTARTKNTHIEKISDLSKELQELRSSSPDIDKMKFGFDNSALHQGKTLFMAKDMNFNYGLQELLWQENLSLRITSGERIALKGNNGSGKTTLIKIILGDLPPSIGIVSRTSNKSIYIDQDYSLIDNNLQVYEQVQQFNHSALQEHEIKIRLNRFLFTKDDWKKSCSALSGGERMRLMLCCLTIDSHSPDLIILDEPTNNLDIQNIEILTKAINAYQGTLVTVSHDEYFLEQIRIDRIIEL